MLQQQMSVLADNQNNTDDRYTRAKQDSAALQARVHMLEEQLRESELRAEERLQEAQKRHRELVVRIEREKQLQIDNCTIRYALWRVTCLLGKKCWEAFGSAGL